MFQSAIFVLVLLATTRATQLEDAQFVADFCSVFGGCTAPTDYCGPAAGIPRDLITCDDDDRIIAMDYYIPGHSSVIPSIALLDRIEQLKILFDTDDFDIDPGVGALTTLTHFLIGSLLGNTLRNVPPQLGNLIHVEEFVIVNLELLPTHPLPSQLGNMRGVRIFSFVTVDMGGTVFPPGMFDLWDNLEEYMIEIVSNIGGALPALGNKPRLREYIVDQVIGPSTFDDPELFNSPNLERFYLTRASDVVGEIPGLFYGAAALEDVSVSFAQVEFSLDHRISQIGPLDSLKFTRTPNVVGSLSPTLGDMQALRVLHIIQTSVSGVIPAELASAPSLRSVHLMQSEGVPFDAVASCEALIAADVALSGTVPVELIEWLAHPLADLVIRDSCIGGVLPEASFAVPSSGVAVFAGSLFTGRLPSWLVEMAGARGPLNCDLTGNLFCYKPSPLAMGDLLCPYERNGEFDACQVCQGDNSTCTDCAGALFGSSRPDLCGECNGDNSCLDCFGTPHGSASRDVCGVCGGTGASCDADCAGIPGGGMEVDSCGVCGGTNGCLDCAGMPHGSLVVDLCGACGGRNLCVDCDGVIDGVKVIDECGNCVDRSAADYAPQCLDCTGTANGTTLRDLCGNCPPSANCLVEERALYGIFADTSLWVTIVAFILVAAGIVLLCLSGACTGVF